MNDITGCIKGDSTCRSVVYRIGYHPILHNKCNTPCSSEFINSTKVPCWAYGQYMKICNCIALEVTSYFGMCLLSAAIASLVRNILRYHIISHLNITYLSQFCCLIDQIVQLITFLTQCRYKQKKIS